MSDFLGARQAGPDAGMRQLLRRVDDLETQLRKATAALGGVKGLQDAQAELAAHQAALETQAGQIPYSRISVASRTNYNLPNNTSIQSLTIPWPAGKTRVDVLVTIQGTFNSGGVAFAYLPVWYARINGAASSMIRSVLYHMDDYYFSGSFAATVTTGAAITVDAYITTGTGTPIPATSTNYLSIYAISVGSS